MAANDSTTVAIPAKSGNVSIQTAATGTNWTAFAAQAAKAVTISNSSGTSLDVRQGGAGASFVLPAGAVFKFEGIDDASQLAVKRTDSSNTQATASARWER